MDYQDFKKLSIGRYTVTLQLAEINSEFCFLEIFKSYNSHNSDTYLRVQLNGSFYIGFINSNGSILPFKKVSLV